MFISELRVFQIRNLSDATIRLANGPIALIGRNGNGKTNFVEAISFLAQGRSFRTSTVTDLIAEGRTEGSVFGKVRRIDDEVELGVVVSSRKRTGFVNGEKAGSFSDYAGKLICVTFDPSDLELVQGGPSLRRSFVDRHLVDVKPTLLRPMMQYQKALASKAALLREDDVRPDQLSPWNQLMADSGAMLTREREHFVRELCELSNEKHQEYAPTDGGIQLEWQSTLPNGAAKEANTLFEALEQNSRREIAARSARFGPHRDELQITLGGRPARVFASQGQCRSLVLSLKLGAIELIERAVADNIVILLDDVDSELDPHRSKRLFSMLFRRQRQLIVTGTREPASDFPYASVFEVEKGSLAEGVPLQAF